MARGTDGNGSLPISPPAGLSECDDLCWRFAVALLCHIRAFHGWRSWRPDRPASLDSDPGQTSPPKGQRNVSTDPTAGVVFWVRLGGFAVSIDHDAVTRRHYVSVMGVERPPVDQDAALKTFTIDGLNVGDQVVHQYSYLDAAGNESARSPQLSYTVEDNFAPRFDGDPGAAAVDGGGQRNDDEPPPPDR